MFDLYKLPSDFPGRDSAKGYRAVDGIECAIREDVSDSRFIPYIPLHAFQTLLLSKPAEIHVYFSDEKRSMQRLKDLSKELSKSDNSELVNDTTDGAPSKRIIAHFPRYSKSKCTAGPTIAEAIGLNVLMKKCAHFAAWIGALREALG